MPTAARSAWSIAGSELPARTRRQTSTLAVSALSWMNSRRGSTMSPISWSKMYVGLVDLLDLHLQQRARVGVERGLPELLRVHLAQALVALQRDALAAGGDHRLEQADRAVDRGVFVLAAQASPAAWRG